MEEYLIRELPPLSNSQTHPCNHLPNPPALLTASAGTHRHVSMRYGIEFSSKVALYAKERASCQQDANIEAVPKDKLFRKVVSFLQGTIKDKASFDSLAKYFKELDQEMSLTVKHSRKSLASECSQQPISKSIGSISKSSSSGNEENQQPGEKNSQNQSNKLSIGSLPKLKKAKTSMMSKCNRISLADAINLSELQKLAQNRQIQIIESSESIQTNSLHEFKSREDLISDPSETQSHQSSLESSINSLKVELLKVNNRNDKAKKISIMMVDDFNSSGSDIFSEEDIVSLTELQPTEIVLSQSLLDIYFECFSPFLVNLALCLMYKCLARTEIQLTPQNVGWFMGVSTLVAYKVYYDEPIEGLMEYFADAMSMSVPSLVKLQRWFLVGVSYEVVVSCHQYQSMMFRLMGHKDNSA